MLGQQFLFGAQRKISGRRVAIETHRFHEWTNLRRCDLARGDLEPDEDGIDIARRDRWTSALCEGCADIHRRTTLDDPQSTSMRASHCALLVPRGYLYKVTVTDQFGDVQ